MAKETSILKPTMTPVAGLRRIAHLCGSGFSEHLSGVMTSDDPEGPHRARVALRRFRAALTGFSPVIDPAARRAMAGEARSLFRTLGTLRDADVRLAGCLDPAAVAGLAAELETARTQVRQALTQAEAAGFPQRINASLAGDDWARTDKTGRRWHRRGLDRLANRALSRAWQECLDNGPDLAALPVDQRHELRKELKTLRYLAEYFAGFWPGAKRDRFLDALRQIQDDLGLLNDLTLIDPASAAAPDAATQAAMLTTAAKSWKSLAKLSPWWH